MTTNESKPTLELLSCASTLTACLIGFSIRWEEIAWCYGSPILFVPLFFISIYSGLRWFEIDLSKTRGGIHVRTWLGAAACLFVLLIEPRIVGPVAFAIAIFGMGWWFRRQFIRAEEVVAAESRERNNL